MIDPIEFGKAMGAIVKEATGPLLARIDQLEKQLAVQVIPSADEVAAQIDLGALAKSAAELVPTPKNGEPGKDADMEVVKEHIESMIKALPVPSNGKDADMEALRIYLANLVKGIKPADPLPAPTVEEIAATFERRFSDLTLSWERQARDTFEKAADRMPKPKDGRDAVALEGFDLALSEDGRTVTVKMQAGETVIEKSVKIAAVLDCGVYSSEKSYQKGDGVTYGGCYWIAQKDAPEGVPGVSKDFRLSVKKGRDGRDLRENASRIDPSKGVSIK